MSLQRLSSSALSKAKGKVEYVVTPVILTNITITLIAPITLPFLIGTEVQISIGKVLQPALIVMFVPLILAQLVSQLLPKSQQFIRMRKRFSFPIWLFNLLIISANASGFLRNENTDSFAALITIALISLIICIVNFGVGALLGGRSHQQEASQSLGQKNLSFIIWIALTFINPLVPMDTTFYIS